ncbi:MAG: DinB family protein [Chloroflexi bacterium]|nr:DinB family protein [Chloroflexota bacterium]
MTDRTDALDVGAAIERLQVAARQMEGMATTIDAGRPWPVGPVAGDGPESAWGPPEVLAHVAEMLGFWLDQMELVIASSVGAGGDAHEPVPMGRMSDDPQRSAAIERDRELPTTALLARIHGAVERYAARLPALQVQDWASLGLHPRLGPATVAQMLDRFVLGHVADHVAQLQASLGAQISS